MGVKFNPFTGNFDFTGSSSGGAVDSVNGQTGTVVLDATDVGADPAGTAQALFDQLGDKYVRTTRFEIINSGTSGSVTLPANSTVVLDDFGGTTDAAVTQVSGSKPTLIAAETSSGSIVATTFDSSGNWSLTDTPSAYPIAILYRVRQKLSDFDSTSSDIWGPGTVENSVTATNIQLFTSSGTWTKPVGAKTVKVYAIGAGGGGGAGRRGAAGTVRCGGGGGSAGAMVMGEFDAANLTSTVAITIGAGGTGATGTSTDNTDGAQAVAGGSTTFGGFLTAPGGGGGRGGTATNGLAGTVTLGSQSPWNHIQFAGANANTSGGAGVSPSVMQFLGPNGGAAGGGISSADAISNGAAGGAITSVIFPSATATGGAAGGVAPANAGNGNSGTIFTGFTNGTGGGSSRSSITGATGNGGNGGNYGAGGGGSGATLNGNTTGNGGNGANGALFVITYF